MLEEFIVKKPTAQQLREWFEVPNFIHDLPNGSISLGGSAEHSEASIGLAFVDIEDDPVIMVNCGLLDDEDYSLWYTDKFSLKKAVFQKVLRKRTVDDKEEVGIEKGVAFHGKRKSQFAHIGVTFWGREE